MRKYTITMEVNEQDIHDTVKWNDHKPTTDLIDYVFQYLEDNGESEIAEMFCNAIKYSANLYDDEIIALHSYDDSRYLISRKELTPIVEKVWKMSLKEFMVSYVWNDTYTVADYHGNKGSWKYSSN